MFNYTLRIEKAIQTACRLHAEQKRKTDPNLPYVSHCFSVACIVSQYTDDEDVIIAGFLHDVLEDVKGYRLKDLIEDFGQRVAHFVQEVSEDKDPNIKIDKKATWGSRKEKYLFALRKDSEEALLICAADKIHNIQSTFEAYASKGKNVLEGFNSSLIKQTWYYQEILGILRERIPNHLIVKELEKVVKDFLVITNQDNRF